ncbi:MAG: hypothetical protein QOJ11_664 [Frankiales bacterium]|jgi:glycosyltransferase involved in cell wall biosynthesis|nr:hypothetical protein [Frankiales bacterium]
MYALAGLLAHRGHEVTVAAPDPPSAKALRRMGYDSSIARARMSLLGFTRASSAWDMVICLTNTIPPVSLCPRSFLVVQFPFVRLSGLAPRRRLQERALRDYACITYSEFVRVHLLQRWGLDSSVVNPPVEAGYYDANVKQRSILAVGRFFTGGHNKRQDALIEAFKALAPDLRDGWRLTLMGGTADDDAARSAVEALSRRSVGYNIELRVNVTAEALSRAYAEASLFWHATGYQRPAANPERAEHFGISTVEAMSYGCVPLAFDDGGQREIVTSSAGVLWKDVRELVAATEDLMRDSLALRRLAASAQAQSKAFSVQEFERRASRALEL